jgi:hypothetical protein
MNPMRAARPATLQGFAENYPSSAQNGNIQPSWMEWTAVGCRLIGDNGHRKTANFRLILFRKQLIFYELVQQQAQKCNKSLSHFRLFSRSLNSVRYLKSRT